MSITGQQSVQAGYEALEAYAKRVKPETLDKVASELLAVKDLFANEPRLRRALTDPGRTAAERSGLAEQVLSGKVSAGTLKVLTALIGQRWSTPGELLTAVESIGVDAILRVGAAQDVLAEVEDELFRFARLVDGDNDLSRALSDGSAPASARTELVRTLLSGKANAVSVRLAEVAAAGFGGRRGFDTAATKLLELVSAKREQRLAYITVAAPLPQDQEARLTRKLSEIYGHTISAKITVDPQVVGGIRVQIGHDLYDGTVARRLTEARKALAARH
ncbi:F0F1 ATP synthase subunit delta [Stackebrandtia nassauensis]|uniref:ATP synthase subunit delta n=1 Tax=Stackebrandtia nassauensis (strain DSM 44728 / CIP 108903 / NRRL B-16338 / NBRC 102104 / LLR-40K-21) TaxID=446470 RepID=D3PU76_STANL|nr:F0F1 ATP synthase subunit delta [Stackebrandtia nassauensis]ADD41022.1 ATP synthase F1, delta subunit [Stackebrandtia nassauensis DSM 44728]